MKYKLIKTYPLCPFELGAVATNENVKSDVMLCIRTDVGRYTTYPKDAIVSSPEFWEEVKEKEYTILSFISTDNYQTINSLQPDGWYGEKYSDFSLEEMLKGELSIEDGTFKIHSVRRESDSETFQLGDRVFLPSNSDEVEEIKGIEIDNTFISKMAVSIGVMQKWGMIHLQKALLRKPILITEDKVEIFEGDKYFRVNEYFNILPHTAKSKTELIEGTLRFSTKEAAQEYIKWNKPMYSLNDVTRAIMNATTDDEIIKELEKLGRK